MGDNFAARQGDDIIHTSVLGDVAVYHQSQAAQLRRLLSLDVKVTA